MRRPDLIIIGAMKCATSSLHDQLAQQPGIFMSTPKEPYFFSNDEVYAKGADWYESLFESAPADALCGESSTHYTKRPTYPHTVERIAKHLPDARFVYVIRHPIDRLISHYMHDWSERTIHRPIDELATTHEGLIDYGRYAMQLQPFIETFGFERVLLVSHEGIRREPQRELERVCAFIGYKGKPAWRSGAHDSNVSNERLQKSTIRDLIVWNPVVTAIRRAIVPQSMRNRVKSFWQMKDRPTLSDDVRSRLEMIFDEDLAQLSNWIGRDIHCANFNEALAEAPITWLPSLSPTAA
jgi:hypothetical protein